MTGKKYDQGKARWDLIPVDLNVLKEMCSYFSTPPDPVAYPYRAMGFIYQEMRVHLGVESPYGAMQKLAEVLTFGAAKYGDDNWQIVVADFPERYVNAYRRHTAAHMSGYLYDDESGLSHLAHAMCCVAFLVWKDGNQ